MLLMAHVVLGDKLKSSEIISGEIGAGLMAEEEPVLPAWN
jgi:hypothetical protein